MHLYIVRHAQGGDIKSNYDELSEHGRKQSIKLGEYFLKNHIVFDLLITGTLNRHIQTLKFMNQRLQNDLSNYIQLEYLNEISEEQFKTLLYYYSKKDQVVEILYRKLQKQSNIKKSKELYVVLFKHIFENWIYDDKNPMSFLEYKKNVLNIFHFLKNKNQTKTKNVLIITSGTPLSIILGSIFQFDDIKSLNWMKYLYNTSISLIYCNRNYVLEPISINYCPHLNKEEFTLL